MLSVVEIVKALRRSDEAGSALLYHESGSEPRV
jgi:hypothetical protein